MPDDIDALFVEVLAAGPHHSGTWNALWPPNSTWHLLGASRLGCSGAVPVRLQLYSGGNFLHEGSIQNAGLFKPVLDAQAADIELGVPEMSIMAGRLVVSAEVAAVPGRERILEYTARYTPMSSTSFRRCLLSLELPEPVGLLTPLVETNDIIEVAYSDDDLLVFQTERASAEFFVHESVQLMHFRQSGCA
mmetsp:Transcript_107109/g.269375  ORF Transcript_107109/g.269375 Transcript_107109/m.269375 type:complete len:191 (+) Transcript_107109:141-713(+)